MKKVLLICILLIAGGCRVNDAGPDLSPNPSPRPSPLTGLRSFEDCDTLQAHLQSLSDLSPAPLFDPLIDDMAPQPNGSLEGDTAGSQAPVTVEEGDIIRHEGNRLYIANRRRGLYIYDTSVPAFPELLSHVPLDDYVIELQLDGTRLAVISSDTHEVFGEPWKIVSIFDVSDASEPELISEKSYRGYYASSRLVGHVLYMALRNYTQIDDWDDTELRVAPCDEVYVPQRLEESHTAPSQAWTLLGLEMQAAEQEAAQVTVLGAWESHILASPEHFYLTNHMYYPDETTVHLFRISPQQASIQPWSQAAVPGNIVNQRAINESEGVFRIASTTDAWTTGERRNYVTTFDVSDSSLEKLGQIDSITPGEWISAARFTVDYVFLTTFVTIDPLVIVDLRDPTKPEVLGELEVPGIARQIEVWGNRLISIGASNEWCGEVLLTLFDISDLSHPQLIDQMSIEQTTGSPALQDYRAYTFHPDFAVLALPLSQHWMARSMGFFHVDPDHGFTDLGTVDHSQLLDDETRWVSMNRSLRVANHHYSISEAGISVSSFFDLSDPISDTTYPDLEPDDFQIINPDEPIISLCSFIDDPVMP